MERWFEHIRHSLLTCDHEDLESRSSGPRPDSVMRAVRMPREEMRRVRGRGEGGQRRLEIAKN